MLAAESTATGNQILLRNNVANFLHLWTLDSNWNWQASDGVIDPSSLQASALETTFQVDANADGRIGQTSIFSASVAAESNSLALESDPIINPSPQGQRLLSTSEEASSPIVFGELSALELMDVDGGRINYLEPDLVVAAHPLVNNPNILPIP